MKQYLFLCIALAATVCKASAQQKAVEQICITVDSMLNAQRKVTAHITMDGYDGPIGIKLLANRLAFLDHNIERFDKDWEPRIQELKEIKMQQFPGGFPFPFPTN